MRLRGGFQGALMDLLPPGDVHPLQVETSAHKKHPQRSEASEQHDN